MFIVNSYSLAVIFCIITMFCWGSWGNTQKLASKSWRYEYFYWDYVIGVLLFSVLSAFTFGSTGAEGRPFIEDLSQASGSNVALAFAGGVIFNLSNILLSAAISLCGMSVAFPVGVGLALVIGVFVNYIAKPGGDPLILFIGVLLIAIAIVLNGLAYKKAQQGQQNLTRKGIAISIAAGIIMAFFFYLVSAATAVDFAHPEAGKMTPYTAVFVFAVGVFISNFLWDYIAMRHPVQGEPIKPSGYFHGSFATHLVGIAGGAIWCVGESCSMIASGTAGPAISYGLGQGATLISALWGILIWKEFKNAPKVSNILNICMFVLFVFGLSMLIYAKIS